MTIIDNHVKILKEMEGYTVEAGWFESARYKAGKRVNPKMVGVPVARIARINEFGATIKDKDGKKHSIPPRPFMRLAVKNFIRERADKQVKIQRQLLAGKINSEQAMAQIGLVMEACIVDSIKNGGWEPNAKSTRDRKGFDKPLIDTGQMWQAVTSKVVKST